MNRSLVALLLILAGIMISQRQLQSQTTQSFMVPNGTHIKVHLETTINSKTNRQADSSTAKLLESVIVKGKQVISEGYYR